MAPGHGMAESFDGHSPQKFLHHDTAPAPRVIKPLQDLIKIARREARKPLDPTVFAFQELLERDAELRQLSSSMFAEARKLADSNYIHIDSVPVLMRLFNSILSRAPAWIDLDESYNLRGLPFNLVLMVLMSTPSGRRLFQNGTVNRHLKAILSKWAVFLESGASRYALNSSDGWLSPTAIAKLEDIANSATPGENRCFTEIYQCPDEKDPSSLGFASWDDFFTRRFKPGVRPLPSPETLNSRQGAPIINACESSPWKISHHCSLEEQFWLKGQPYSMADMLDNDPYVEHFVGGTVYQAYLSALSYHRWHAPISGIVKRIRYVEGNYFSHMPMLDPLAMEKSQGYLACAAIRALVFIEASDPRVGLICLVTIGMGEVSSCDAVVNEGDHVEAGDEIGTFHYGGSTHCLVFGGGVDVRFEHERGGTRVSSANVPVNSLLARCYSQEKSHL
ncbi:hypothetical protein FQN54_002638 [Arachnomyces sp. PD_36]|nr:hypothetical protein FQN54_002638 [Arachnomyces sp. PD_36]